MSPYPAPCDSSCGAVYVEGATLQEITCRCGYGYYDDRGNFVNGSLVRAGKALSKEQYVAHVRECRNQQNGAPVLRAATQYEPTNKAIYIGARADGQAAGDTRIAATVVQVSYTEQPSGSRPERKTPTFSADEYRHVQDLQHSRARDDRISYVKQSVPEPIASARDERASQQIPRLEEYVMPKEGIRIEVIRDGIQDLLGPDASVNVAKSRGQDVYLIRAARRPSIKMIAVWKRRSEQSSQPGSGNSREFSPDAKIGIQPRDPKTSDAQHGRHQSPDRTLTYRPTPSRDLRTNTGDRHAPNIDDYQKSQRMQQDLPHIQNVDYQESTARNRPFEQKNNRHDSASSDNQSSSRQQPTLQLFQTEESPNEDILEATGQNRQAVRGSTRYEQRPEIVRQASGSTSNISHDTGSNREHSYATTGRRPSIPSAERRPSYQDQEPSRRDSRHAAAHQTLLHEETISDEER